MQTIFLRCYYIKLKLDEKLRIALDFPLSITSHILLDFLNQEQLEFINLYVTEACNLNCPNCLNVISRNRRLVHSETDLSCLSLENFMNMIKEFKIVKPFLLFAGGEPTLNKDVFAMIYAANKRGFVTSMSTNGTKLDKIYMKVLKSGLKFIIVSIDGFQKDHDSIRGRGSFYRTLNGLKKLVSSRNHFIHIKVNIVVNKLNYYYLFNLVKFIFSLGIDEVCLQHFSFFNLEILHQQQKYSIEHNLGNEVMGALIDSKYYLTDKQINILENELIKIRNAKLNVDFEPPIYDIRKYYQGKFPNRKSLCRSLNKQLIIRANGDVEICQGYILGNINTDKLTDMFKGEKAKFLRNFHEKNLFPACYRCCRLSFHFD